MTFFHFRIDFSRATLFFIQHLIFLQAKMRFQLFNHFKVNLESHQVIRAPVFSCLHYFMWVTATSCNQNLQQHLQSTKHATNSLQSTEYCNQQLAINIACNNTASKNACNQHIMFLSLERRYFHLLTPRQYLISTTWETGNYSLT